MDRIEFAKAAFYGSNQAAEDYMVANGLEACSLEEAIAFFASAPEADLAEIEAVS